MRRVYLHYVTWTMVINELQMALEAALEIEMEARWGAERGPYVATPVRQTVNRVRIQPNDIGDPEGPVDPNFAESALLIEISHPDDAVLCKRRLREIAGLYLVEESAFDGNGPPWDKTTTLLYGAHGSTYDVSRDVAASLGVPFELTFDSGAPVGRIGPVPDTASVEVWGAAHAPVGELRDDRFDELDQLLWIRDWRRTGVGGPRPSGSPPLLTEQLERVEGLQLLVEVTESRGMK